MLTGLLAAREVVLAEIKVAEKRRQNTYQFHVRKASAAAVESDVAIVRSWLVFLCGNLRQY